MDNCDNKQTFKHWIKRYENRYNPMGDLARDIADDSEFPDTADLRVISLYLIRQTPCPDCIKVFRIACKRYTTWLMKEMWE